jgi:tetratricopeptide (TPR) repeat protein
MRRFAVGLVAKKDLDGALAAFRESIRLDPKNARAHNNLGNVLRDKKDLDGAVAALKEAIRLEPAYVNAHINLGKVLSQRGEPHAALAVLEHGNRLNPVWMYDLSTGFRYNSACYAALAATGLAKDSPPETERPALRRKALDWLRADLALRSKQCADDPKTAAESARKILHWLKDADLASVREPGELAKLPVEERAAWEKLWADARALLDAALPPEAVPPRVEP